MSKMNLLVHLNGYQDVNATNNPSHNNFKWNRDAQGIDINEPTSKSLSLPAGQSLNIFSGTVATSADATTTWDIALKPGTTQTYILSRAAGTNPVFRTGRVLGVDAASQITVTQNATLLILTGSVSAAAVASQFVGQVLGMTTNVTIDALTAGSAGNVTITGDGVVDIAQLVIDHNSSNPSNQISVSSGDDTQIPDLAEDIVLSGGVNGTSGLDTSTIQIGDDIRLGPVFSILNQGKFKVLSKTATSLTIENAAGMPEGPITLGAGFAEELSVYSSAGVQIGDKIDLSSGFSSVSFGTYEITDATPEKIEIHSINALPSELGISNSPEALTIYNNAKSFVYIESNRSLEVNIDGAASSNKIEPIRAGAANIPGIFMSSSSMKSLTITNKSLDTATIFYVTAE